MNKLLLLALTFFISIAAFAQANFEPGYFIDNDGNRIDCLINNVDRIRTPTQVEYKLTESSEIKLATLAEVQAFEILDTEHKYERHTVDMDRSPNNQKELDYNAEPTFKEEQLFLKVLVEGDVNLYAYNDRNSFQRFFLKTDTNGVQQLVYKKFMHSETIVKENNTFRQQLWANLPCSSFSLEQFLKIGYRTKDLAEVVVSYHECINKPYKDFTSRKAKGEYKFSLKAGANYSSLYIMQTVHIRIRSLDGGSSFLLGSEHFESNLEPVLSPMLGFEFEYLLPINNRKWTLFVEPTYQHFDKAYQLDVYRQADPYRANIVSAPYTFNVKYHHLILPAGLRYNYYVSNNTMLFAKGALAYNLILNKDNALKLENYDRKVEFEQKSINLMPSARFGVGFRYLDKYSAEINADLNKVMLENTIWKAKLKNSVSLTLGYRLK